MGPRKCLPEVSQDLDQISLFYKRLQKHIMMKATKTWKSFELRIAKFFGAQRNPLSGGNSKHTRSDSLHPVLFVECKWRQKSSLCNLYRNTVPMAKVEGKIPVLAITDKATKADLIVMRKEDLLEVAKYATEELQQVHEEI
jgi:hypothetical protein